MKTKGKLLSTLLVSMLVFQSMSFQASAANAENVDPPIAHGPVPSESQLQYHEEELSAFIHFGMNTFTNSEWGNGKENPNSFNPTELDTDQWVKTLKDAGFKRIIMIGRHHDGFCLWQSDFTEHDVSNSSDWQKSQKDEGDILLSLSKSCTKYDMDMGLYLSPWDANNASYGYGTGSNDATDSNGDYNEYYMNQLREILGNPKYGNDGKFVEVWMDGAKGSGAAAQKYRFQDWFDLIEELQPGALVFSPYGTTVRWVGNESGLAGDPCWSKISQSRLRNAYDSGYEEAGYLNSGDAEGDIWSIAEADVSIESGWFWHNGNKPKSMEQLTNIYFKSVGRGQPLLLNLPPDSRGKLTDDDVARVTEFGNAIKTTFASDLTDKGMVSATASSIRGESDQYAAGNVLDDDKDTYWTMDDEQTTGTLTVNLGSSRYFDVVSIEEYIKLGQRISDFTVEVHTANGWQAFGDGHTIGAKRLVRNTPVSADQIRINITGAQAVPLIENVGVYKADKQFEMPRLYPDGVKTIDNTEFKNTTGWNQESIGDNNTSMYSSSTGTYAEATFTGSKAWIYGTHDSSHGDMEVWIDGKKVADVDTYRTARKLPALLYTTDDLTYGEHTIKMVVKGSKNAASRGTAVGLDFLAYLDNDGAGMFEMAQDSYTVDEGNSVDVTINRIGGSKGEASVHFSTSPDTAVHGRHYNDVSVDVTFADGQTQAIVPVEAIDNMEVADNLRFFCQLDQPTNKSLLGFNITSDVTIRDNDGKGRLETALNKANEKMETNFTSASWEVFVAARIQAQTVYDDESADQVMINNAVLALEEGMNALVKREKYTSNDPLVLPSIVGDTKAFEAEYFTLQPTTPLDKHVRVEDVASASNGKMVTWFETGDVIKVPYFAAKAGTYTMSVTYYSGRSEAKPNKYNWSGEHVQSGSIDVFGPNASVAKTATFDIVIDKAGAGEILFTADGSSCPNTDKFEITAKELQNTTYTVQAIAGDGGSVDPQEVIDVVEGEEASVQAIADDGYHFVSWTINGEVVSKEALYTFIVTDHVEVIANFEKDAEQNVYKDILKNSIDKCERIATDSVLNTLAPNVAAMIRARLNEAKIVFNNETATQEECLNAWLHLANAMQYLDFKAEKHDLQALVEVCETIDTSEYTSGVEAFEEALESAKAVLIDENALQARIDETYTALMNAKNALVKSEGTQALLENIIKDVTTLVGDGSKYRHNDAWDAYIKALDEANALLANEAASDAELMAAILNVTNAYENLRLLPDESLLAQLHDFVAYVNQFDLRNYRSSDVARILAVQSRAVAMYNDPDHFDDQIFASLQLEIVDIMDLLNNPNISVEDPKQLVEETVTPETTKQEASVNAPQGNVKTGDTSAASLFMAVTTAAGACLVLLRKRRK